MPVRRSLRLSSVTMDVSDAWMVTAELKGEYELTPKFSVRASPLRFVPPRPDVTVMTPAGATQHLESQQRACERGRRVLCLSGVGGSSLT